LGCLFKNAKKLLWLQEQTAASPRGIYILVGSSRKKIQFASLPSSQARRITEWSYNRTTYICIHIPTRRAFIVSYKPKVPRKIAFSATFPCVAHHLDSPLCLPRTNGNTHKLLPTVQNMPLSCQICKINHIIEPWFRTLAVQPTVLFASKNSHSTSVQHLQVRGHFFMSD